MIERLMGNGLGCCDICLLVKGFHRLWTTSLYHVKNSRGLYLRSFQYGVCFSSDTSHDCATYCYGHALMVNDVRKALNDWDKEG